MAKMALVDVNNKLYEKLSSLIDNIEDDDDGGAEKILKISTAVARLNTSLKKNAAFSDDDDAAKAKAVNDEYDKILNEVGI